MNIWKTPRSRHLNQRLPDSLPFSNLPYKIDGFAAFIAALFRAPGFNGLSAKNALAVLFLHGLVWSVCTSDQTDVMPSASEAWAGELLQKQ